MGGMKSQNLVKQTLSQPESLLIVQQILEGNSESPRSAIAGLVCKHFEFFSALGKPQIAGCLKALRELERIGKFELPKVQAPAPNPQPKRLEAPVEAPLTLPSSAGQIQALELIRVEDDAQTRIWNELMIQDHPRGAGPFFGAQIRYLIRSEHGWLGGLGFSASARHLKDRDQWIGWDPQTRMQHLDRIINMSRFLIRTCVRCPNLASKVLGMSLRCIADDVELRYGYRPWLVESFVDLSRHTGSCYQASSLVVTTDGLPLGLLGAKCEAPPAPKKQTPAQKKAARKKPIEQKKTFNWIAGLRDSNTLAAQLPSTRQVCVMDREADFYALFCGPRRPRVELLVRAKHDRGTGSEHKLFDTLRQSPVCELARKLLEIS